MIVPLTFYTWDPADQRWEPDPAGLSFFATCPAEVGAGSAVVNRAWVRWGCAWGSATWRVVAWDGVRPVGEADPARDYWELPAGTRLFTVEGTRSALNAIPSVALLQEAR